MTLLREANNALAAAWQEAAAKKRPGQQRLVATAWKVIEGLCETEEAAAQEPQLQKAA